ncbi:uncharacterized protein LOC110638744 [Hevea brasiliensis]|uniref:uncharacterized protein LOC110638744 n=1 Tax=Hevea brasiliensis TaxID=3981 RepID=UPI0025CFEF17|nr:uncharacterized protein LOC110638744 [Hevea brasiliensis]
MTSTYNATFFFFIKRQAVIQNPKDPHPKRIFGFANVAFAEENDIVFVQFVRFVDWAGETKRTIEQTVAKPRVFDREKRTIGCSLKIAEAHRILDVVFGFKSAKIEFIGRFNSGILPLQHLRRGHIYLRMGAEESRNSVHFNFQIQKHFSEQQAEKW